MPYLFVESQENTQFIQSKAPKEMENLFDANTVDKCFEKFHLALKNYNFTGLVAEKINAGLHHYYQSMKRDDYLTRGGVGKFCYFAKVCNRQDVNTFFFLPSASTTEERIYSPTRRRHHGQR